MRRYVPPGGSTARSDDWSILMAVYPLVGRLASLYANGPDGDGPIPFGGAHHGPIVIDKLVADGRPRATLDRRPRLGAVLLPPDLVAGELGHRGGDRPAVAWRHQVAGAARQHQVERAAGRRGDDWQATGHR